MRREESRQGVGGEDSAIERMALDLTHAKVVTGPAKLVIVSAGVVTGPMSLVMASATDRSERAKLVIRSVID